MFENFERVFSVEALCESLLNILKLHISFPSYLKAPNWILQLFWVVSLCYIAIGSLLRNFLLAFIFVQAPHAVLELLQAPHGILEQVIITLVFSLFWLHAMCILPRCT